MHKVAWRDFLNKTSRGILATLSRIYDRKFCKKGEWLKVKYCWKKVCHRCSTVPCIHLWDLVLDKVPLEVIFICEVLSWLLGTGVYVVIKLLMHWPRQTIICFLERLKMTGDSDSPILFKVLYLKKVIVQLVQQTFPIQLLHSYNYIQVFVFVILHKEKLTK